MAHWIIAVANNGHESTNTGTRYFITTDRNETPRRHGNVRCGHDAGFRRRRSAHFDCSGRLQSSMDVPIWRSRTRRTTRFPCCLNHRRRAICRQCRVTGGYGAGSIASADFNADGDPDVAMANNGAANVSVILNTASFSAADSARRARPFPGVEYLDVGLKVKATPRIHPNGDVTLQFEFRRSAA